MEATKEEIEKKVKIMISNITKDIRKKLIGFVKKKNIDDPQTFNSGDVYKINYRLYETNKRVHLLYSFDVTIKNCNVIRMEREIELKA